MPDPAPGAPTPTPVYYSERYDFYALSRFDDVCEAHKDWPTFSRPGDDMLSELTQVEVDRGDGVTTGLTDVEIAGYANVPVRVRA